MRLLLGRGNRFIGFGELESKDRRRSVSTTLSLRVSKRSSPESSVHPLSHSADFACAACCAKTAPLPRRRWLTARKPWRR